MSTSSAKSKSSKHSPRNPKKERKPSSRGASHSKAETATKSSSSKPPDEQPQAQPSGSSTVYASGDKAGVSSGSGISICVLDDCKHTSETFLCDYDTLVKKMPYFKDCLDSEPEGDFSISVHCDIAVFKVIMDYIACDAYQEGKRFRFDPKLAVHLLVSADFLQMAALVDECLNYCYRHMNVIIENNCPVGALNENLLGRLASLFSHREVEALKDPNGRIKEKLYKVLLELFLKPDRETPVKSGSQKLFKCSLCDQVIATKLQPFVSCKNKKASVGHRGELIYNHKRDINWNIDKYVEDGFQSLKSWRKLYWKTWGLVNVLQCSTCRLAFSCSEFTRCRFHPEPVTFPSTQPSQNVHEMGTFSCCGAKTFKFDPLNPLQFATGCAYRNHTVTATDRASDVFQDMLTYSDLICLPDAIQVPPAENQGLSRIVPCFSERAVAQWSHATNLDFLIKTGSKQSISSEGSGSVTTKSSESLTVYKKGSPTFQELPLPSSSEVETSLHKRNGSSRAIAESSLIYWAHVGFPKKELKQAAVFTSVLCAVGQTYGASDAKQIWKPGGSLWHNQDAVREHDNRQMELMMLQFQKLRNTNRLRGSSPRKP